MPSLGRWLTFGTIPLLAAMASPLVAQAPAPSPSSYANEASVVEKLVEKISYSNDGTYTDERTARIRIQSAAGVQQYGLLRLPYPSSVGDDQISYVRVTKPDGTVVSTPPENIQDLPEQITIQAPFYSDLKEKQVAVKGLETGDVLEFNARFEARSPEVPGQFWSEYSFHDDQIVLDEEFQIAIPAGRAVTLKSPRIQPTITDADGQRVYSWKTNNLQHKSDAEITKENASSDPKFPDIQLTSFRSWDEVAQWYRQLQTSRADPTPEIRAKAAELTKNAKSDAEKIGLLYDYVSTKFRYIGIAFGIGRYQPHTAAEVLGNGFGDCKDKYTLLAALLASVGIKSYPALANAQGKFDTDIPSPSAFNHVITAVPRGQDFLWLDTTTEVAPQGYLSPGLRDNQVLLIPDSAASLIKLPALLPFSQKFTFGTVGKVTDDGTLVAHTDISVRGDAEVQLRIAFHQVPQPQWKELVQKFSEGMYFVGTVDDVTASSPEATGQPLELKYTYTRKNYPNWPDQIGSPVPSPILSALPDDDNAVPDRIPLSLGETLLTSEVELPPGVTPTLRAPVNLATDFAEYHASATWMPPVLHFERHYIVHVSELPKARSAAYRTFWKNVNDDENATLALAHGETSDEVPSLNVPLDPEAKTRYQKLLDATTEAVQKKDFPSAIEAYQQVLALYATTEGWFYLANLELSNHERGRAYEDMKKGLALKPTSAATLNRMATAFVQMHNDDDALEAWKKEMQIFPDNLAAPEGMGAYFIGRKRYAEALAVLQPAAEKHPESAPLNYRLGLAYLGSTDSKRGAEAFARTISDDPSQLYLNNTAYELAVANVYLDDALRYGQQAVAAVEQRTQTIQADSLNRSDLGAIVELAMFWDTLGWVQFQRGNFAGAEQYLTPAWILSQSGSIGDHLGRLYEKEGRRDDAIRQFKLASAAQNPLVATADHLASLLGDKDAAANANAKALDDLSQMRRIKLPRLTPGESHAEVFLFYRQDGLTDVRLINGDIRLSDALLKVKGTAAFPKESSATIVRRGIVSCGASNDSCDLVLLPPSLVTSVN